MQPNVILSAFDRLENHAFQMQYLFLWVPDIASPHLELPRLGLRQIRGKWAVVPTWMSCANSHVCCENVSGESIKYQV